MTHDSDRSAGASLANGKDAKSTAAPDRELSLSELEKVAGGGGGKIDPNGPGGGPPSKKSP